MIGFTIYINLLPVYFYSLAQAYSSILGLGFYILKKILFDLEQGVLEAVRISLAGYPTRRAYSEFVDRFGLLAPECMDTRL